MSVPRLTAGACVLAAAAFALPASSVRIAGQTPAAVELGTINFPTSAKPAAQAPFLVGTKALYNFEFDIAAEAFQQSQKADPGFALAYWGEAMSYNHPLWAQQDLAAARRVLERLAPTAAARPVTFDGTSAFSMAMHVHSSFSEQSGSMDAQLFQAVTNAVDVLFALTLSAPPETGSFGDDGLVTMPPVEVLASGPDVRFCQRHGPPSPAAGCSLVRLVKCTVFR